MKITIIGPLSSGKSTLACDLRDHFTTYNYEVHEEAFRVFHSQGIVIPIGENTTQESALKLFNYSVTHLNDLSNDTNHIVLGSPFDEFMYMVNAMNISKTTDLNMNFLDSIKETVCSAMSKFDLILKIENFDNIPYELDGVRPEKTGDYRASVNEVINELIDNNHIWNLFDTNSLNRILKVSGSREERVKIVANYLTNFKSKTSTHAQSIFTQTNKPNNEPLKNTTSFTTGATIQ